MAEGRFFLFFIALSLFMAIAIHELGRAILFILFGVPVETLAIGFGPAFSVLLQNPLLKKISFGLIPLSGFTVPGAGWELLSEWKLILINFAGVAVNLSVPLAAAYFHQKRGIIFSQSAVLFFDINLCLLVFNIAPLPGLDGAHAYMNMASIFGLTDWFEKFYSSLNIAIVYAWIFVWIFMLFHFMDKILRFLKKFIRYYSPLIPR